LDILEIEEELFRDVDAVAGVLRGAANATARARYLGSPCRAMLPSL